ncbi:hypothetical protein GUJ93_ZPchr0014g46819 [Zizania palustris]|uniref:PHD-type domain-containing protein n=1 Tax=Zizania palustris TaxID=103762 RepID=A0A8J5SVH9_ZIZPA|nr:hypothetical protein GUJ93_ZPchr0014g46819 [Zizania palustris]
MDVKDLFAEIGMKEEDITTMLFGKKVVELTEDAFDNSKEERDIFEGLFCRTGADGVTTSLKGASKEELISINTPSSSISNHNSVRCRIVESFTHGNLSSYLVFCHNANHQTQKKVAFLDVASAPAPMVQWTPPSIERVYTRRAVALRNQRAKLCRVLDLEKVEITGVRQHKDGYGHAVLWNHLRLHANLLMMDAGWKIEERERGDKSKVDKVYEAPDKVMRLYSLPRAWKCFGQWLLMSSCGFGGNDYGRVWFNIHDFLSDLKNTLLCLEHEVRLPKQSLSFLNQWQLLDPFMAVVCIDKKVAALKNGVALKAVNSTVTFVSCTEGKLLSIRNASNSLGLNHANNYSSTHPRSRKNLLPLLQSDPLYFPPNSSSDYLAENIQIKGPDFHACDVMETANVDNSADSTSDELLLGAKLLFSHEMDEMLTGTMDDISNEQHFTAAVSDSQEKNSDAGDRPSGPSSLLSEMDRDLKANKNDINNEQYDSAVVPEPQLVNKDVEDGPVGAPSLLPQKDTVLEGNETSLEEVTETRLLSCEATDSALMISEPQLLFVSPQDGTLSFMNDSMYSQEMRSCLSASDDTLGTNMQLNIHSSVYEASLIQGFLYLDNKGSPICWTFVNPEPPRQLVCTSGSQPTSKAFDLHGEMNIQSEPLTSEPKQTSAFDSSENSRKRSKKAANIEDKTSRKKQKINDVPVSYRAIDQYMECTTKNPAVRLICNGKEQIRAANIEHVSLNLLPGNNSDKNEGTEKPVLVNNNGNDQAGVSIGSTEMIVLEKSPKRQKTTLLHRCKFGDSDLLVTAVIHRLTARYRNHSSQRPAKKVGFKRLPRCRWESEERYDMNNIPKGARTVLGKLLEMGIVCKVNILQYRRPGGKIVLKDGNITKKGIRCRCCDTVFTMSGFKCHAGLQQEIPSLNLFLGSGKSYTLCQLQAWSIEHKARKERAQKRTPLQVDQNDDTCGLCGDGGDLICCDNCPASYHQDCLPCQDIPDGSWYCYSCLCDICGEVINLKDPRSSIAALECSQCERQCNLSDSSHLASSLPPYHLYGTLVIC